MRLVFAGTPEFAVPTLRAALASGHDVVAVYTQPDRPAGRGRQLAPSPVKQLALAHGIDVRQPETLRDTDAQAALQALAPDLMIVVAYGLLLPQAVLDIPKFGAWNVHASLLPRWRGAAPIQRAIEAGDPATGVCLMQMRKGLDTGPVLLRSVTPIRDAETSGALHDRLATLGANLVRDGLGLLGAGLLPIAMPQASEGVVYAHKLDKAEARLDWTLSADALARRVRAFSPWPVAEADIAGERVRIHRATALEREHDAVPGSVLGAGVDGIDVACGSGVLRLQSLQRDGGRPLAAADYLNARPGLRA
ncbi:methionyl-tRNA formyltransferase [Chiayiivirga flava]|uniref:methionyl-tRNA formyltransferase n=1 Tax=Chiayiivirga flava TaxID=659595 RepID=UPI00161D742C|nr:methionyl-tRNA formyltransferase [Chiayiivirga flava]